MSENVPATDNHIKHLEDMRATVQKLLEQQQQRKDTCQLAKMKVNDQVWLESKNLCVKGTRKLLPK
jgi:hypothetical protein